MKRVNYPRREWWLDDQRAHRPRQKRIVSFAVITRAKQHWFDADTNHIHITRYDLPNAMDRSGSRLTDWMKVVDHPYDPSHYFDGQLILVAMSDWFGYTARLITFHKDTADEVDSGEIYVLKSDYYDLLCPIKEKCEIQDLI